MASNEPDKIKGQRAVESATIRPAENNFTLESYLRNSLVELDSSVPKVNGVVLASRLGKDPKLGHDARGRNSLTPADKWGQGFEPDWPTEKRPRKLFASILPYLAVAIICGGISGGALLYLLLHYAAPPQGAETSDVAPAEPGISHGKVSDNLAHEQSPSFNPVPKTGFSPPARAGRSQDDLTENAGSPSGPPAADKKPLEVGDSAGSVTSDVEANAKEADVGNKIAAIAPLAETVPMPPPLSSPKELREEKPAESDKVDLGVTKRETRLPKLPADQEEKMLKRASSLLSQNDIAGARLIFQYLVNHASAGAAFALAESYDPKKLAGRRIAGMTPDANLARVWYERAAELGSKEAAAIIRKDKP